jgi:glycosyltransferase involved in cell wall biosynthesis
MEKIIEQSGPRSIELLGQLPHSETLSLIKNARFLIFSTEWYETFGRVVIEAYSVGVPVIASNIGAVSELIDNGETGLLFNPGDPVDLTSKVNWLWNHPQESARMGHNARRAYEEKYTPEQNYTMLMDIYQKAIEHKK